MSNVWTESAGGKRRLQEIPLAEGGVKGRHETETAESQKGQQQDPEHLKKGREKRQERFLKELEGNDGENEGKLKSSSLKRFFGMAPKKSSEPIGELGPGQHGVDVEGHNPADSDVDDDDGDEDDVEDAAVGGSNSKRESYRRFKLRLGGMHRYSTSRDSESRIDLNSSASKATLKSSLSSYWNSVFKKKKSKSVNDMGRSEGITTTNFLETVNQDQALPEEMHALKISDDSNTN